MDKFLPLIDVVLCDGCGLCVTRCANQALGMVDGKAAVIDPERCNYDAACEAVCPTSAIALPYQVVFAASE
ncbi:MAG: 4Fe-4S binding protein [Thermoflexales bacterium]|nr:4Fe-4S binding protein [Thermoflexales bacterium]